MFSQVFVDVAWSDDAHAPHISPHSNPLTIVRRPVPSRASMPTPRAEGQILRRWRDGPFGSLGAAA